MNSSTLLVALLVLLASLQPSEARLRIIKAYFGRDTGRQDVSELVEAYVSHGQYSFLVNTQSMGGDPAPGQVKYLYATYEVDGQKFTDSVQEGQVFTFRGVVGIEPVRPFLGVIPPAAPSAARVQVTNQLGRNVVLYAVDSYGHWTWMAELQNYETFNRTAAVGQRWKVMTRGNEELQNFVVRAGVNNVSLMPPAAPFLGGGVVRVNFENRSRSDALLYTLNRWGAWEWVARLDGGASYGADARVGDTWVATDRRGGVIRQVQISPNTRSIRLER